MKWRDGTAEESRALRRDPLQHLCLSGKGKLGRRESKTQQKPLLISSPKILMRCHLSREISGYRKRGNLRSKSELWEKVLELSIFALNSVT